MKHLTAAATWVGCLLAGGQFAQPLCADEVERLLRFVPHESNAIVVVHVHDIVELPESDDAATNRIRSLLSGQGSVPPWAHCVVRAALVRPSVPAEEWSVAVLPLREGTRLETVAWHEHTSIQQLGNHRVVGARHDAYFVELQPDVLAIRTPAFRQGTSRWLQTLQLAHVPPVSTYLSDAAKSATHVLMALDLRDAFDPLHVRHRLEASESLAGSADALDKLTHLLAGLQGIRLGITGGESVTATLTLDFSDDPSGIAAFLRPVLLETLGDLQAEIDELKDAGLAVERNSVEFRFAPGESSVRRMMSLVLSSGPGSLDEVHEDRVSGRSGTGPREWESSRYFRAVSDVLDDLQRASRRATDYWRTATWHESFARKIELLNVSFVEPGLVEYGSRTTSRLRALAASLRGVAVEVNTQQQTITYDVDVRPGRASYNVWGGYGWQPGSYRVTSNLAEVRSRQATAIAAGAHEREQIWRMMLDDRRDTQQQMESEYGPDFGRRTRRPKE